MICWVALVDITVATIMVSPQKAKSLKLIKRSGTVELHVRLPDLQMLLWWRWSTKVVAPVLAARRYATHIYAMETNSADHTQTTLAHNCVVHEEKRC